MNASDVASALEVVRSQLAEATRAKKCHACGCLHKTVEALQSTDVGSGALAEELRAAKAVFAPKEYDCLGCAVCFPALAANAFAEAYPGVGATLDLCPADEPAARTGWPSLPGDYTVIRYRAPVAICTLASESLAIEIAARSPDAVALVGTLQTENLGIERVIRNVLSNPHIRFLIVCGDDSQRQVGHLAGQSLLALGANGIDDRGRIREAPGKRPFLKNVSAEQVSAFLRQVELVPMLGETSTTAILERASACAARNPGAFEGAPDDALIAAVEAAEPERLVSDPAGYLVVYPDRAQRKLVVEHYANSGALDAIVTGRTATAVYSELIARGLLSRMDHAAYLGRELARAELNLTEARPYIQDRAPGRELDSAPVTVQSASCGCDSSRAPGASPKSLTIQGASR